MKRLFLCFIALFLLSGCIEKRIIDDINIVTGIGFDKAGNKQMIGTFSAQIIKADKSITNQTFISKGSLRRDLLIKAARQSSQPLVTGGVGVTVVGGELGKDGIKDILDVYQRDVSIGARNYFAMADGQAKKILQGKYGTIGTGDYLYNLLDNSVKSKDIPKTNLHLLLHDYYQKGKDIYLPILKQKGINKVEISGISFFKADKVAGVIPPEKMPFFNLLVNKYSKGNFSVPNHDDGKTSIKSFVSKHTFKIAKKNPSHVTIQIKIKGSIQEYTGRKLTKKEINKIQKSLERKVEKECLKLVKDFQEKNADPIGLGEFYKSRKRSFDFKKWENEYKNLNVKIICNVIIEETGIID
ncbi:spore germination protein QC [Neobacillus bataviensis LMG 21833]|uniref:Spore germination protein QC n=1 Tax=Neobacillus bataviensis LMG 21833 TaxID=1117379 RepID=K6C4H3_9BACI|nr:Ger(x)C family spore germination protein [Neobacillus bataviensis]EKN66005.1 spore germination protein QC [Neobacillus bataviensis LMG 21833]